MAFLNEQCREIEENDGMGKTRDLFKKIGKIKETQDIREAEETKMKWQEYIEELYKKDLNDPDNHDGVVTHLEQFILECEVKWALKGSITTNKVSWHDGIPIELFKILKDDGVKVLHRMSTNLENSATATELEKVGYQSQGRAMPKNVQTTIQLHSFHVLVRLCSKSFKLGFRNIWTESLQMYKLSLEKTEEPEIELPTFIGS